MLINQAKNLAACRIRRCSSCSPRSSVPAASDPGPAHRLQRPTDRQCFLDHLCAGFGRHIQPDAGRECTGALADLDRGIPGCAAGAPGVVGNLDTNRTRRRRWSRRASRVGALQATQPATSSPPVGPATRRSHRNRRGPRRAQSLEAGSARQRRTGQGATPAFPDARRGYQPPAFRCSTDAQYLSIADSC